MNVLEFSEGVEKLVDPMIEPDGDLFSLTFFPEEMKRALFVPMEDVKHFDAGTKIIGKIKTLGAK